MKKFFMAFLAVATIAMVGCKKDETKPTPTPSGGGDDPVEEMPDVAAPAAGKTTVVLRLPQGTPGIVYAVGTVNDWKEKDYEACPFEKIEGYDNRWVKETFDWDASMEMKVLAVPTKPELAGWTYQWAKNIDEENPDPAIKEDHVVILKGGEAAENFVYENQGQPKLKGLADQGVIYIDVKAWAENPVIPTTPATYLEIKHNWQSGEAWTWRVMEAKGDGKFEYRGRYGKSGCNLRDKSEGDGAWYPDPEVEEGLAINDSVLFSVKSIEGAANCEIKITLIEKGEAKPFVKADHAFGIIGSWDSWAADKYALEYVADEGDFYVAEATNVAVEEGTEFKVRENGAWAVCFGYDGLTIAGDADNFEDAPGDENNNIRAKAAQTYSKVTFKFKWDGAQTTDRTLTFTK